MPSVAQAPLEFKPVGPTKANVDWAQLRTIDMATFDDGLAAQKLLAAELKDAMHNQGFFYIKNYGITPEEIKRQVDIANTVIHTTPLEVKEQLRAQMQEQGTYKGFKLRGYYVDNKGIGDRIEQFNWFRDMKSQEFPETIMPFFDEVKAFTEKVHNVVLFNVLRLFALALELPIETFVEKHKFDVHDESWMRYMAFYDEYTPEEEAKHQGQWMGGHCDFGSVTMLFSQPMASLQVRDDAGVWRYVKHQPGNMVINAGEFMNWYTGGYFKAAIHRVFAPPADQRNHTRLGVFYFVVPNDEEKIETLMESPVLQAAGVKPWSPVLTSKVYSCARISKVGKTTPARIPGKIVHEEVVPGVATPWYG